MFCLVTRESKNIYSHLLFLPFNSGGISKTSFRNETLPIKSLVLGSNPSPSVWKEEALVMSYQNDKVRMLLSMKDGWKFEKVIWIFGILHYTIHLDIWVNWTTQKLKKTSKSTFANFRDTAQKCSPAHDKYAHNLRTTWKNWHSEINGYVVPNHQNLDTT